MRSPSAGSVEDSSSARFQPSRRSNPPDGIPPVEGLRMRQVFTHEPVMVDEVVALFAPVPAGVVIDATAGGGGHAAALLGRPSASARARASTATPTRWRRPPTASAQFGDAGHGAPGPLRPPRRGRRRDRASSPGSASGVLFDLGVSSPQLDRPERGFSYRADAPLDMRMDPDEGPTAADLVNTWPEAELARLFAANGEGRFARRIARAVVAARPVTTTGALADVVRSALPAAVRRQGGHPARRVFQALRVAVNEELEVLAEALPVAIDPLAPGGRCVVISYHSGEDRIVKAAFRHGRDGRVLVPPRASLHLRCGVVGQARVPRDAPAHAVRGGAQPACRECPAACLRAGGSLMAVATAPERVRSVAAPARVPVGTPPPRRGVEAPGRRGPRWPLASHGGGVRSHRRGQPAHGGGRQRLPDPGAGPPDPDAAAADLGARPAPATSRTRVAQLSDPSARGLPVPAPRPRAPSKVTDLTQVTTPKTSPTSPTPPAGTAPAGSTGGR